MKKLEKIELHTLSNNEMNQLVGGEIVYVCTRSKETATYSNGGSSYELHTFETTGYEVATSWCAFWRSAGWHVTINQRGGENEGYEGNKWYYA